LLAALEQACRFIFLHIFDLVILGLVFLLFFDNLIFAFLLLGFQLNGAWG
jgi:hypothetical protein